MGHGVWRGNGNGNGNGNVECRIILSLKLRVLRPGACVGFSTCPRKRSCGALQLCATTARK
jgi:hypothetical protein